MDTPPTPLNTTFVYNSELKAGNVVKMQFGSSRITRDRESGDIISLADDLKAAATDALKKTATLFGVGLHLHGGYSQQGSQHNSGNGNGNSFPARGNRNRDNQPAKGHRNGGNGSGSNGGNGNGSDGSNGNGNNRPSESDGNGNGRLSTKQFQYLQKLNSEMGRASSELDKQCLAMFGTVAQHLSKGDASRMIEQLMAQ